LSQMQGEPERKAIEASNTTSYRDDDRVSGFSIYPGFNGSAREVTARRRSARRSSAVERLPISDEYDT